MEYKDELLAGYKVGFLESGTFSKRLIRGPDAVAV